MEVDHGQPQGRWQGPCHLPQQGLPPLYAPQAHRLKVYPELGRQLAQLSLIIDRVEKTKRLSV